MGAKDVGSPWTGTQIAVLVILLVVTNTVTASTFYFLAPDPPTEITPPPTGPRIVFSETEFSVSFDYRGQSAVLESYRHLRVLEDRFEKEWVLGFTFRENQVNVVIDSGRGPFSVMVMTDRLETRIVNEFGDISVYVKHGDEMVLVFNIGTDRSSVHTPPITNLYVLVKDIGYRGLDGITYQATGCDASGNCKLFTGRL